jgi:UDP-glucose 4-epimerase
MEELAPSRVLLTGASGFIGQHVTALFVSHGIALRTVGRRPPPIDNPLIEHVNGDIRQDFRHLASGCDCVVHLAGLSDASSSFEHAAEYALTNVIGSIRALDAARYAGASFVLASTMRVYRPSIRPISEDAAVGPVDPYGESKLQAESWAEQYARLFGVRATALRLFSVYGPGQVPGQSSGVVAIFMAAARAHQPLRVRARQFRDFVDVRDVARAVELAVRRPAEGFRLCNVGSGQATSIAELGDLVRSVTGSTAPSIVDLSPGAESYVADPRKAKNDLNFAAEIDLLDGLVWYNRHLDGAT